MTAGGVRSTPGPARLLGQLHRRLAGRIRFQRRGAQVPGDFNNVGTVDAADYVEWRTGLGTLYTLSYFDILRALFGTSLGPGSGSSLRFAESLSAGRARAGHFDSDDSGGARLVSSSAPCRIKSPNNPSTRDTRQQPTSF
jgi:hypothetical protein